MRRPSWSGLLCAVAGHAWLCVSLTDGKVAAACPRCLASTAPLVIPRRPPAGHTTAATVVRKLWAREPLTAPELSNVDPLELARLALTLLSIPAVVGDPGPLLDLLETAPLDARTWGEPDA